MIGATPAAAPVPGAAPVAALPPSALPLSEFREAASVREAIVRAVSCPVSADLEAGYGQTPADLIAGLIEAEVQAARELGGPIIAMTIVLVAVLLSKLSEIYRSNAVARGRADPGAE